MMKTCTRKPNWSVKTNNKETCSAAEYTNTPSQLTTKCMHTAHVNSFITFTTHQNNQLKMKCYRLTAKKHPLLALSFRTETKASYKKATAKQTRKWLYGSTAGRKECTIMELTLSNCNGALLHISIQHRPSLSQSSHITFPTALHKRGENIHISTNGTFY